MDQSQGHDANAGGADWPKRTLTGGVSSTLYHRSTWSIMARLYTTQYHAHVWTQDVATWTATAPGERYIARSSQDSANQRNSIKGGETKPEKQVEVSSKGGKGGASQRATKAHSLGGTSQTMEGKESKAGKTKTNPKGEITITRQTEGLAPLRSERVNKAARPLKLATSGMSNIARKSGEQKKEVALRSA